MHLPPPPHTHTPPRHDKRRRCPLHITDAYCTLQDRSTGAQQWDHGTSHCNPPDLPWPEVSTANIHEDDRGGRSGLESIGEKPQNIERQHTGEVETVATHSPAKPATPTRRERRAQADSQLLETSQTHQVIPHFPSKGRERGGMYISQHPNARNPDRNWARGVG